MIGIYPNPETMRDEYFVFLSIDGTLIDLKYGQYSRGPFFDFGENTALNPESIEAVNLLLESLEQKYDTRLVITSGRRKDLIPCVTSLYENGLKYNRPITCTSLTPERRGQKIVDFMMTSSLPKHPKIQNLVNFIMRRYADHGYENYVVLENNTSKIRYEIPPKRRIITNAKKKALQPEQVIKYLKENNLPIAINEQQQQENI